MSPDRASLGIALIAKDSADTLGACLDSVRPYVSQLVVCVDGRTTDKTKAVAKKHGAEVHPVQVSDWHECVQHGRVMAQHFANARQESFKHLDPKLDFHMWIDADDVVDGAEKLPQLCAALPEDSAGVWLPYHYSYLTREDGQRQVNTLFHRERVLRTHFQGRPLHWQWEGRVHETVKPVGIDNPQWWVEDQIQIVHQEGAHKTNDSAPRNTLLLEIDWEEEPDNPRTAFYLGNQYFAMNNWPAAIDWYETLCSGLGKNPYELWQAYLYMSLAYERIGDLDSALRAAQGALEVVPFHGEPYFRVAAIEGLAGEYDKTVFWNELGRKMKPAPFFVFKNPLDYSFNQRVVQGEAFMHQGKITQAKHEWEEAGKVFMDDRLAGALTDVNERIANMTTAQAFVDLAKNLPESVLTATMHPYGAMPADPAFPSLNLSYRWPLYQQLPEGVKAFGRTRDIVMPALLKGRAGSQPRIIFYCGQSLEPWYPGSLNTTGIGGSETAVIEIAKRFARDGWLVDVYNGAERFEGVYDGVGYWEAKRLQPDEKCEVFVSWRNPEFRLKYEDQARQHVLWCHDLNYGPTPEVIAGFRIYGDGGKYKVLGVSQWHADMLRRYYDHHDSLNFDYVPNGIDLERFANPPEKIAFRCVYASSADRGLARLLQYWPEIVNIEPTAELHVAYGWETMDRMIAMGRSDLAGFKADMERKIAETKNVVWRGRLGQADLAQLYGESYLWLYPTDFLEVSCISAMEAMAGGAVPITTECGALAETIGGAGLLVPGPTSSRAYKGTYLKIAIGAMTERITRMGYAERGRERAQALTWDAAYDRWKQVLGIDAPQTSELATA